jgi:Zn-finger nucleic acid-binding protein
VLWEVDASEALDDFVRWAIAFAAELVRDDARCLAAPDHRALDAWEARERDAADLVAAARDEAARRVIGALEAVREKEFRFERHKRIDYEDDLVEARRSSALAHAAAAFDDALAHALERDGNAARVAEDVARAVAWASTANVGGTSLHWDRIVEQTRAHLDGELESRLLALAPRDVPEIEEVEPPEAPRPTLQVTRSGAPLSDLIASVRRLLGRALAHRLTFVPGSGPRTKSVEVRVASGLSSSKLDALRADITRMGRELGLEVTVTDQPETELDSVIVTEPGRSGPWAVFAHAASGAPTVPLIGEIPPRWAATQNTAWALCPFCGAALNPDAPTHLERARCPRCGHRGLVQLGEASSGSHIKALQREDEAEPRLRFLVTCGRCLLTGSVKVVEREDIDWKPCPRCDAVGALRVV